MVIIHLKNYIIKEQFYLVLFVIQIQIYLGNPKKHFDEENDPMFEGCFIIGINTPTGEATYHIKLKYWEMFDVPEIEHAPKYDGYSSDEVLKRLQTLR